jgi:SRSO17 transposase
MAARVHPQNVRSAHQSMHHLVADADWSDQGLLAAAVTAQMLPARLKKDQACHCIVDDTGFAKKGTQPVGGHDGLVWVGSTRPMPRSSRCMSR